MLNKLLSNRQGRMPNWLGATMAIALIAVTATLIVWYSSISNPDSTSVRNANDDSPAAAGTQAVTKVSGTIVNLNGNVLQVLVPHNIYQENDKIYYVTFDKSTSITKTLPPQSGKPGETVRLETSPASVADLQKDVKVIIETSVDVGVNDEFFASSIEIR